MNLLAVLSTALLSTALLFASPQTDSCQVTQPNNSPLPETVAAKARVSANDPRRYGNGNIWTDLWPDGTVLFRKGGAGFILKDGSLQMKFLWLMAVDGPLTVSGKRLDAPAPPMRSDIGPGSIGAGFQPSYLIFPTQGCWQVTAKANGSELAFVTRVAKTY